MISITVQPQTAAHIDVMAQAMKALLASLTPPAVAPTQEQMVQAIQHAEEIKEEKVVKTPKSRKVATPSEVPADTPVVSEMVTTQPAPDVKAETAAESPSKPLTLEDVRLKLVAISRSGKEAQVKALIAACGVSKLTDIPADKYAEVLEKAEAL